MNIHYGDILIKFGDTLDCENSLIPFVSPTTKLGRKVEFLQDGDCIIADTAEDETVGKVTELYNIGNKKVISGLHTIPCRPLLEYAQGYLGYYLNSQAFHSQLYSLMQGIKVLSISKSNISRTTVKYPSVGEQKKISTLLDLLDRKIDVQKKLIDLLKLYKRGVAHHIFTLLADTAQQGLLKDYAHISTGCSNTQDAVEDGIYPFFIRSQNIAKSNRYVFEGEAVLTIGDGQIGKVFHYINGRFDCHQRVYMITNFSADLDGKYFYHFFSGCFLERALRMSAKNTVDSVRMEMISDMPILIPSIEIQRKIVTILDNTDAMILNENNQQHQLRQLKNGLAQQLFI